MNDLDPTKAESPEDLAECLRQLHIRADKPAFRELEQRTIHANGLLAGTRLKRVRLGRTALSEVLAGRKFPGKAFMLTLVETCGIVLENDPRWGQAWDRLAPQYLDQPLEDDLPSAWPIRPAPLRNRLLCTRHRRSLAWRMTTSARGG
jgi:hypothetical protein